MWLRSKTTMKIRNRVCGVGDVFRSFPGAFKFVVAHPVHQIVEFAALESGIEERINLELRYTIHLDGKRDLHDSTWERVGHMRSNGACRATLLRWQASQLLT